MALYWINGQGDFHQFVANRVAKIQEHNHVKWHHVSTHENPAAKLRRLVKHVRSKCYGCLRFRAGAYEKPPPGKLPSTRTQGTTPFQVVGVDFAGPI